MRGGERELDVLARGYGSRHLRSIHVFLMVMEKVMEMESSSQW